jgi:hypothetical protein
VRAILGPYGGVGNDPTLDLNAQAVMFNAKPNGADGEGDWLIDQSFRQVGLVRNPQKGNQVIDSDFTELTGQTLSKLFLTSVPSATGLLKNEIVSTGSGSQAYIDDFVDSAGAGYILVHQDDTIGYGTFAALDTITGATSGAIAQVAAADVDVRYVDGLGDPEADLSLSWDSDNKTILGGELLFIDNRVTAIERASGATEDIKVVIQF